MPDTLLKTKLRMPPVRTDLVVRNRLTTKLERAWQAKLTLITAPAGFGKTTLVQTWVEASHQPVAWLSLDEQDNNPARFFLYLIHACRQCNPGLGTTALNLLDSPHQPHLTTVLTLLINDLSIVSNRLISFR